MAPPIVSVNSLAEAQELPSNVTPRRIDLLALDAVRDAPPILEIVRSKVEAGWSCPELPRLGKVARFAELLAELSHDILPRLMGNPADRQALRRLRGRGEAIHRLRARADGVLADLADPLANPLSRAAREVLRRDRTPQWLAARLHDVLATVEKSARSYVVIKDERRGGGGDDHHHDGEDDVYGQEEAADTSLPIIGVCSLAEAQRLKLLPDVTPRRIDLLALDAVRDAPPVLEIVRSKVEAGWSCPELPRLGKVARFAELLAELSHDILPRLMGNPADRQALRRLRGRGEAIHRLRARADGVLADLADPLANPLSRAAREVLRGEKSPDWLAARLNDFLAAVQKSAQSYIAIKDEENGGDGDGGKAK